MIRGIYRLEIGHSVEENMKSVAFLDAKLAAPYVRPEMSFHSSAPARRGLSSSVMPAKVTEDKRVDINPANNRFWIDFVIRFSKRQSRLGAFSAWLPIVYLDGLA